MLEYKNVTIDFKYNTLFRNISFDIKGKTLILGPNSSGKTTLIRATCGLIKYKGFIYVDGLEVRKVKNYLKLSTNLSEVYSIGITVRDVAYILEEIKGLDQSLFNKFLKEARIYEQVINKPLHKLSTGQSSIIRLALALSSNCKNCLIDEPFENLDPDRRMTITNWIKDYFTGGFLTTHELDMLKKFNDWDSYIILNGRLYGPIMVNDLIEASVVEGNISGAIIVIDLPNGKKISLIKDLSKGTKLSILGSINRIYGVV
jgi:ABC-type Mn/Zn transport systems, ATPase component